MKKIKLMLTILAVFSITSFFACSQPTDSGKNLEKTPEKFTVTFKTDEKEECLEVLEGTVLDRPEDPTKDADEKFLGWVDDSGEKWDFNKPVLKNMTLSPKWGVVEFSEMYLSFDISDGQIYIEISGENFTEKTLKNSKINKGSEEINGLSKNDSGTILRLLYSDLKITGKTTLIFTYDNGEEPRTLTLEVYEITIDPEGTLTKFTPIPKGELILPKGIKKINNDLFKDISISGSKDITKVVFPESLEEIGESAFENCRGLETIVFNNNLQEIGAKTFYKNESLKSIELPENLISIGDSAFENCRGLEIIVFNNNLQEIGAKAFYIPYPLVNTPNNKLIKIYGNKLTTIGSKAFNNEGAFKKTKPITFEIYDVSDAEFENIKTLITANCNELTNPTFEKK